jgi:hypothetical protein
MFYYLLLQNTKDIDEVFNKFCKTHINGIKNISIKENTLLPKSIYFETNTHNDINIKKIIFIFLQNINYNYQFEIYKPLVKEICII